VNVVFDHSEPIAHNIRTFWFRPDKPMYYLAGQYTELTLPHDNPDNRGIKRWFTLSSSPTDEMLSITTKFAGEQSSSFKKHLFEQLKPGTQLHMADPMGDFVLPKDTTLPLVFVAGGIGLTPFHSMIKWLQDTDEHRDIQFLYGVRHEDEQAFHDLFASYGVQPITFVSEPTPEWQGETGKLDAERILRHITPIGNKRIYVSGPEQMVQALTKDLEKHGVPKDQLINDEFPGYTGL